MAKRTEKDKRSSRQLSTYLGSDYLEAFNEMLDDLKMSRYEYLKSLVLLDMRERGFIDGKEIRRRDREGVDSLAAEV